jgi:hypothetical protein
MKKMKSYFLMGLIPLLLVMVIGGMIGCKNTPTTPATPTTVIGTATITKTATLISTATVTPTSTVNTSVSINLGAAASYGAMGGTAGLTNQGINTVINGDIGTTGASSLITGFHDASNVYTETTGNIGLVTGTVFYAGTVTTPLSDAQTAYNYIAGLPAGSDQGAGHLGGLVLAPGTYTSASGTYDITGSDLTLDSTDSNAVWIFQAASSLTVGTPTQAQSVILLHNAQARNVYWVVGSSAVINYAGGGTMVGTIIANTAGITLSSPANATAQTLTTLNGRALSLNASVTMVQTTINLPQ